MIKINVETDWFKINLLVPEESFSIKTIRDLDYNEAINKITDLEADSFIIKGKIHLMEIKKNG